MFDSTWSECDWSKLVWWVELLSELPSRSSVDRPDPSPWQRRRALRSALLSYESVDGRSHLWLSFLMFVQYLELGVEYWTSCQLSLILSFPDLPCTWYYVPAIAENAYLNTYSSTDDIWSLQLYRPLILLHWIRRTMDDWCTEILIMHFLVFDPIVSKMSVLQPQNCSALSLESIH